MRNIVIMVGAPCSGKSELGKRYARDHDMQYISSGDIARNMDSAKEALRNGEQAPEQEMRDKIKNILIGSKNHDIVLDGFPRTEDQLNYLIDIASIKDRLIFVIVDSPTHMLIKRALLRNRHDDTMDTYTKRLQWYVGNTLLMICNIDTIVDTYDCMHKVSVLNISDIDNAYNHMESLMAFGGILI